MSRCAGQQPLCALSGASSYRCSHIETVVVTTPTAGKSATKGLRFGARCCQEIQRLGRDEVDQARKSVGSVQN